ncbi:tyrosine-type recombinase/integrase [Nocardia wallacei]|uniref:tyrosine-type recombinase/integrase n=1 Tax=Nocardia wallacei TaxID=480035 RepID=UPI0024555A48|nr:tyrosine-type recombinase/integrase [Nocardia wallacei]
MPPKKQTRRPRGTGGLSQRKSGKNKGLWTGTYIWEDEYGEKHRAEVSSMDKQIANQKLRDIITEIESGAYAPRSKMTVQKWFDYWVENIVKPHREPGTYRSYRGIINNQIVKHIGDTKRLPITAAVVRGNLKWVAENWSPRTAELTHAVWSKAMKDAVKEQVIKVDPTQHIDKPVNDKKIGKALTVEQARRVLLTATKNHDPMVTRWAAALMLAARQGELLGLRREMVDLQEMTIDLSWQLQSIALKPGADITDPQRFDVPKGMEIVPLVRRFALKRRKGNRPTLIPLPVPLAAIFKAYMDSTPPNKYGLMWVSPAGDPIDNKTDNQAWHSALEAAKVPGVRLHDARHTTNMLLLEMGVEESVRMQILGQSTVAAQRRYTHVDLRVAREALGNLDVLLALE